MRRVQMTKCHSKIIEKYFAICLQITVKRFKFAGTKQPFSRRRAHGQNQKAMTIESAGRLISAIIRKDQQRGYFLHQELRRCIIDSRKGGDWEHCQEPNGIPYDQTEFSNTAPDGSMCKWQWGAMGGFVFCKTSIYTEAGGWTSTVARKPVLFSDVLLIELKKYAQ